MLNHSNPLSFPSPEVIDDLAPDADIELTESDCTTPVPVGFSKSRPILEPDWTVIPQGWFRRPRILFTRDIDRWELEYDTVNDFDEPYTPELKLRTYGAEFALANPVPADKLTSMLTELLPNLVELGAHLDDLSSGDEVTEDALEIAEVISDWLRSLCEEHVMDLWEVLDARAEDLIYEASEFLPDGFELSHTLFNDGYIGFEVTNTETGESVGHLMESDLGSEAQDTIERAVLELT